MTAAEMAALRTLAPALDVGVPLAEFPRAVVDGLVDQGFAAIVSHDRGGDFLSITLDGLVESL